MRLKKGVKKGLYNIAMISNFSIFAYCGLFKELYIIGLISLLNSLYFNIKAELLEEE